MSTMRSASPPETAEPFANVPQTLRGRASTDPGRRPRTVARNRWSSDQPVRMTGIPLGSRLSLSPPRSPGHPSHAAAGLGEVDLFRRLSAHWDHKCAVERLTQLEQDEALARRLQEQEDHEYAARLQQQQTSAQTQFQTQRQHVAHELNESQASSASRNAGNDRAIADKIQAADLEQAAASFKTKESEQDVLVGVPLAVDDGIPFATDGVEGVDTGVDTPPPSYVEAIKARSTTESSLPTAVTVGGSAIEANSGGDAPPGSSGGLPQAVDGDPSPQTPVNDPDEEATSGPRVMVLTSTEVPHGFLPPPALDYSDRFEGSVHKALSAIRAGKVRIPSAAFTSAAFAAAAEDGLPHTDPIARQGRAVSTSSTGSTGSAAGNSSPVESEEIEVNVTVTCTVPQSGGFKTAFACSGGHVFVEEFIEKETATPASVPALTPSHSALPVPKVAYGRSIGLREGDIIVAVNGVNCLDVKVVDPPPPAYNEISKDVPENPPPNVFQCWERFRETLQGIVAKGPGTPLEFSIFRPDSTGAQKGNEDLVMPAELENVPRPRVSDNAQSGCIFVRSKRLSRAAKADVYYKIKYMSLDDATALAARIKAADALEDGAPPNDNSSTQSAQPEPDAPPPVAVAPHLEYPCSLRAIVEHLTHPHFVDRDDMFLTTFFYSCWCFTNSKRVLSAFIRQCQSQQGIPRSHLGAGSSAAADGDAQPRRQRAVTTVANLTVGLGPTMSPVQVRAVQALQFWCQLLRTGHANADIQRDHELRKQVRDFIDTEVIAKTLGSDFAATSPVSKGAQDDRQSPKSNDMMLTESKACNRALRNIGRQFLKIIDALDQAHATSSHRGRDRQLLPARKVCLEHRTELMHRMFTPAAQDIQARQRVYDWSPEQVATQITLSEYFYYYLGLSFRELENVGWTRAETKSLTSPTVLEMIDLFNKRVFWIVKEIIDDKDDDDDSCSESDRSDDEGDTTEVVKALVSPRRSARTSSARTRSKSSNTAIDRDIRRRSRKSPHYGGSDAVSSTDRKWFFDRAARVEYFIEVALVLRQLGNFYGLFEVMLALTDPYVSRLRHTWTQVDRHHMAAFVELKDLTSSAANYKPYRLHYAQHAARGWPRIPALHISLRDLASMEYAGPSTSSPSEAKESKVEDLAAGADVANDEHARGNTDKEDDVRIFFSKYLAESEYIHETLAAKKMPYRMKDGWPSPNFARDGGVQSSALSNTRSPQPALSNSSPEKRASNNSSAGESGTSEEIQATSMRRTRSDTMLQKLAEGLICPRCRTEQASVQVLMEHAQHCSGSWVEVEEADVLGLAGLPPPNAGQGRQRSASSLVSSSVSLSSPSSPTTSSSLRKRLANVNRSRQRRMQDRSSESIVKHLASLSFFAKEDSRKRKKTGPFGTPKHSDRDDIDDDGRRLFAHDLTLQSFLASQVVTTVSRTDLWEMAKRLQHKENRGRSRTTARGRPKSRSQSATPRHKK